MLWQGFADAMVPASHGRWLADRPDGSLVHRHDGEGHLSIVTEHLDHMLDELVEKGLGA